MLAALALGCEFGYIGTRFIVTEESMASHAYRNMILSSTSDDIVYSPFFTGVPGNYLVPSIVAAGIDPAEVRGAMVGAREVSLNRDSRPKTWKDIWGAGQGVGGIDAVLPVRALVDRMIVEYRAAKERLDAL